MIRTRWVDRKFTFDFPEGWIWNILERLNGTSARLKQLTDSMTEEQAGTKFNGKWSIKEHIGHLSDLEELHEGRIDDFISRKQVLRAADMSNLKTNQANHNNKSVEKLIREFSLKRKEFISRLEKLDDEILRQQSLHPRLKITMRPVDMACFTAEHDDHHLTTIHFMVKSIENKGQLPDRSL